MNVAVNDKITYAKKYVNEKKYGIGHDPYEILENMLFIKILTSIQDWCDEITENEILLLIEKYSL